MRKIIGAVFVSGLALACLPDARTQDKNDDARPGEDGWTAEFPLEKGELVATGRNPYFVLEPGFVLELAGDKTRVTISVLNETKRVDGTDCRVVEERKTENGKLAEVTRNYYAISKRTNCVYHFGEDADEYTDGKVSGHDGAWLAGKDGAKFGLAMPGQPLLKSRFYQELAPKVAMDRAEIVSTTETVKTPAGEFKNCLKVEETTPLDGKTKEYKFYARGIGLVQDGDMKLVKYSKTK